MKSFVLITAILLSPKIFAERYDGYNNPENFNKIVGSRMVKHFDSLPLAGKLNDDRLGWSETYWPSNKGGIAYRWNHPDPQPFKYRLHSKQELLHMNQEEIGQLSPAELYDISQGDYSYSLTRKVLGKTSPKDLWWEGICHGWALAASNYPEPAPVTIKNRDGIIVPFGASDVKGLLALHDAYNYRGTYAQVGRRCNAMGKVEGEGDERDAFPNPPLPEAANSRDCKDLNAGSFHVSVANMIGIHSRSFVADVDRFNDVWNQPVTSYSSKFISEEPVTSEHRSYGVERRVKVATRFTYGEELKFYTPEAEAAGADNFVSKLPVTGTPHQEFRHKDYEYVLELDEKGEIIGGEWLSETRPDFMWAITRDKKFNNRPYPLSGLNFIYRPVKR
ncbi:MAG: hypothetical protein ACLGHN_09780 [Bacteriovoracia bacterium]